MPLSKGNIVLQCHCAHMHIIYVGSQDHNTCLHTLQTYDKEKCTCGFTMYTSENDIHVHVHVFSFVFSNNITYSNIHIV